MRDAGNTRNVAALRGDRDRSWKGQRVGTLMRICRASGGHPRHLWRRSSHLPILSELRAFGHIDRVAQPAGPKRRRCHRPSDRNHSANLRRSHRPKQPRPRRHSSGFHLAAANGRPFGRLDGGSPGGAVGVLAVRPDGASRANQRPCPWSRLTGSATPNDRPRCYARVSIGPPPPRADGGED